MSFAVKEGSKDGRGSKKRLAEELRGVSLPDKRFTANIISIAEHLDEHTGISFSAACSERLRKSAWRLFSTEELDLLQVHQHKTFARCTDEETILIAQDTTDICYRQPHKQGMGELGGSNFRPVKGLNMHTALAMNTGGQPLGIVHQKIWAPKADKAGIQRCHFAIEEKETIKWIDTLRAVNERWQTSSHQQVILIADREADFFEHYAQPKAENVKLLVRVQQKKGVVQGSKYERGGSALGLAIFRFRYCRGMAQTRAVAADSCC